MISAIPSYFGHCRLKGEIQQGRMPYRGKLISEREAGKGEWRMAMLSRSLKAKCSPVALSVHSGFGGRPVPLQSKGVRNEAAA